MSRNGIEHLTRGLVIRDGIWYADSPRKVSYPKSGNVVFSQIEDRSFWYDHRNRCVVLAAGSHLPHGSRIVEVGGGNGYVTLGLKRAGFDTALVEPDPEGIGNARKRGLENLVCAAFEDLDIPEGSLEHVGLFDVLEHVEDDEGFLRGIHRSMRQGSRVILTVPAYPFLWSDEDDHDGHHRRYRRRGLSARLTGMGFAVRYATYFFTFLPLPIFLFRTIPSRIGVGREYSVESYNRENRPGSGRADFLLAPLCRMERNMVARGKTMGFGGSILMVAEKR